jgi:hypothetical protein
MESFLHVSNKEAFEQMLFEHHLSQLRREITYHMLHRNESDFFDIDTFNRNHVKNIKKVMEMVSIVTGELKILGWNTHLGFGDTGLYVYSTAEKPPGVY